MLAESVGCREWASSSSGRALTVGGAAVQCHGCTVVTFPLHCVAISCIVLVSACQVRESSGTKLTGLPRRNQSHVTATLRNFREVHSISKIEMKYIVHSTIQGRSILLRLGSVLSFSLRVQITSGLKYICARYRDDIVGVLCPNISAPSQSRVFQSRHGSCSHTLNHVHLK